MNVRELIAELSELPLDAEVRLHWDGGSRTVAEAAWLAQGGHVALSNLDQPVYDDEDRIAGAPTSKEDPYLPAYEMLDAPQPKWEDN